MPGFRPPEAGWRTFGEAGSGCLGVSRGFDLNVRVAGSNTIVESEFSYDVPLFPGYNVSFGSCASDAPSTDLLAFFFTCLFVVL